MEPSTGSTTTHTPNLRPVSSRFLREHIDRRSGEHGQRRGIGVEVEPILTGALPRRAAIRQIQRAARTAAATLSNSSKTAAASTAANATCTFDETGRNLAGC